MPVTKVHEGCKQSREVKSRVGIGYERIVCGRPFYLDGVCAACWRCKETLRKGGTVPFQATGGVAERMSREAYERLYIEDDTLVQKGIDRDVSMAMENLDDELRDLLGPSKPS